MSQQKEPTKLKSVASYIDDWEFAPMPEHWSVVVSVDGDDILCISDSGLAGREPSVADQQAIIGAAKHLLSFSGCILPLRVRTGKARPSCPDCHGSGLRDSGGTEPWGCPIEVPCDCNVQVFGRSVQPLIARNLAEWHEDDGDVSWWAWCGHSWAGEPAWVGRPTDEGWPGYHTHWTAHPPVPSCIVAGKEVNAKGSS